MSSYLPTLKQLQYLVALKEQGHFGKAADACFVTQSTLSAGIRELESLIGVTLVERTRRVVRFTALGDPAAARHAFRELFEHVILPILVLIIPMGMASLMVIRKALAPLGEAVTQLQVAERHQRGVLIDHAAFPTEAVPFAQAVNRLLGQLDQAARLVQQEYRRRQS